MHTKIRMNWLCLAVCLVGTLISGIVVEAQQSDKSPTVEDGFFDAIKKGNLETVNELLKQQPSLIRASTKNGTSPILLAVYADHSEIAESLIARGIDVNIFEAAATGRIDRVRELVKKDPALVKTFSPDGWTALHLNWGHFDIAKLLVESGSDVNAISRNKLTATPLQGAVVMKRIDLARLYIEHGAKVNIKIEGGGTSLHEAAGSGLIDFAQLLLDHGADVNARDVDGKTPLTIAIEYKQPEMAKFLGEHGGTK